MVTAGVSSMLRLNRVLSSLSLENLKQIRDIIMMCSECTQDDFTTMLTVLNDAILDLTIDQPTPGDEKEA